MGQEIILNLLEREKRPFSRMQIAEELNENCNKISELLRKMIDHEEIKFYEIDRNKAREMFGDKAPNRRMKLYFSVSCKFPL